MYISLPTNAWMFQDQSLKLAISPDFKMNISVPGNMVTLCEGSMICVWHRRVIFGNCIKSIS
jgi:hypothetical protein